MRALLLASLVSFAAAAEAPAWTRRFDELWQKRDEKGVEKELGILLKEQLAKDPAGFEPNWRLAYLLTWQANGAQGGELKAALGKAAWEAGDKAVAARPDDVRGHYFSGTGVGLYSEGVGILTALSQGLEGKFRDRIQTALKLDKDYLDGSPQVVWGRYFFRLPWPKRDVGQSIRVLREAAKAHPDNWRAKLYLADALADDGHEDEGKTLAKEVLEAKGGKDPPEERRLKNDARQWLSRH